MDLWMSVWSNPPYYCYKLFGPGWSVGYLWPYYSSPFGVKIGERFEPRWWFCWNRVESPPVRYQSLWKKKRFSEILSIYTGAVVFFTSRAAGVMWFAMEKLWAVELEVWNTLECMRCHREFAMVATVYWYGIHMNCWARVYIYIYKQRLDIFLYIHVQGLGWKHRSIW